MARHHSLAWEDLECSGQILQCGRLLQLGAMGTDAPDAGLSPTVRAACWPAAGDCPRPPASAPGLWQGSCRRVMCRPAHAVLPTCRCDALAAPCTTAMFNESGKLTEVGERGTCCAAGYGRPPVACVLDEKFVTNGTCATAPTGNVEIPRFSFGPVLDAGTPWATYGFRATVNRVRAPGTPGVFGWGACRVWVGLGLGGVWWGGHLAPVLACSGSTARCSPAITCPARR